MRFNRVSSLFIGLLLLTCWVDGVASKKYFTAYGLNDGLDQLNVRNFAQDHHGYIWVGTVSGLYRFDGHFFEKINFLDEHSNAAIVALYYDRSDSLWVSTRYKGVHRFQNNHWEGVETHELNGQSVTINSFVESPQGQILASSNQGVFQFNLNANSFESIGAHQLLNERTVDIKFNNKTELLILTPKKLMKWRLNSEQVVVLHANNSAKYNHQMIADDKNRLWVGSSQGLTLFDLASNKVIKDNVGEIDARVVDLLINDNTLWVASIFNGLIEINLDSLTIQTNKHDDQSYSISDSSVTSLFYSDDSVLWVGTFNGGVNTLVINNYKINFIPNEFPELSCLERKQINHVLEQGSYHWMSGEGGLNRVDLNTKTCINYLLQTNNDDFGFTAFSSRIDESGQHWVSTSQGLKKYSNQDYETDELSGLLDLGVVLFSFEKNGQVFIGTTDGLKLWSPKNQTILHVEADNHEINNATFINFIELDDIHYMATSRGLAILTDDNDLEYLPLKHEKVDNIRINAIGVFKNHLLVSIENTGIQLINIRGELIEDWSQKDNMPSRAQFYSFAVDQDDVWLLGNYGLMRYQSIPETTQLFDPLDGFINESHQTNNLFQLNDSELAVIGKQGLVTFEPQSISINQSALNVVLTDFYWEDLAVSPQSDDTNFKLPDHINDIDQLLLTHRDRIIGFGFVLFDYANTDANTYQYRLLGLNDKWVEVKGSNRKATYTNLSPGEYQFQVKAANKNGVWSAQPKTLDIIVKPAPWLSPLAYALYVMLIMAAIFFFIRHRTASARKRAVELEVVINERTQELKTQKQMVESLLDHKNELFANVTHEFKTPLALIKGPTEQLLEDADLYPHQPKLKMIKRNANRLLVMVGQILKLSEVEQDKAVVRENQAVSPVLNMLYESYRLLAEAKNISLEIKNQSNGNIYATAEFLEMVVGNLLSNAIKFTPVGGHVLLTSHHQDKQVVITVKDSGSGIAEKDRSSIFDRFTRLDTHRNIQGTGIGLAVVKEITQANGGQVSVDSELGKGSTFTIQMPIAEWQEGESYESVVVQEMVENTSNELIDDNLPDSISKRSAAVKLLVIEDNLDMRTHVGEVLQEKYQCLFADRGRKGIAIALKEMPDIVICDVMMPEMDGFQVTRILRNDAKTSHIPIILLTALNTKDSRIKGWRENIDVYLTKPFDAKELHATLNAVLNVRKILQQKTQASLSVSGTTEALDLPKQDLKFVNKIKHIIADNYHDSMFMRPQLASQMAVSERQLQRKVKALIDESPMSLMRNYRLEMAAQKLTEGFQVSLVGDECGFSSVSYFASCFKKKYGMTPKKYQLAVNKNA